VNALPFRPEHLRELRGQRHRVRGRGGGADERGQLAQQRDERTWSPLQLERTLDDRLQVASGDECDLGVHAADVPADNTHLECPGRQDTTGRTSADAGYTRRESRGQRGHLVGLAHRGSAAMNVVGVIDLLEGRAVHARAGIRERYQPVVKTMGRPVAGGDAIALAQAYLEELGVSQVYVADLDAIMGRQPQDGLVTRLASLGAPLWVDAGISTVVQAERAFALGVSQVVVGLETLASYAALDEICLAFGGNRVAFSLDTREGEPLVQHGGSVTLSSVETIAARAAQAGAGTIIALDLARVGTGRGPDIEMLARLRSAAPGVTLMAGGGVRDAADLDRLTSVGCDGALVASALLSGRLRLRAAMLETSPPARSSPRPPSR
jgi:phosphoribosylformimino-5-aminoimidazole carboxamide ribotide isomerase